MSDYRAIAATTVTLQNMLTEAIREVVPGAAVATGTPPAKTGHELTEGLINIFLYKVEPNPTWRNEELPVRAADGSWIRRPQLAINLFFLLSFYGDDVKQIPSLLLGTTLATLHAEPYPHRRHFPQARPDGPGHSSFIDGSPNLAGSGLLNQRHGLSFSLLSSEQDEVIQTWTQLLHQSYTLSVAYVARVVLIEPAVVPAAALPARRTDVRFSSTRQPRLESLAPAILPFAPAAELRLRGQGLTAEHVRVAFGGIEVEPLMRSATELRVLLPDQLQAGAQPVNVVHGEQRDDGPLRWSIASNQLSVVIQPVLLGAAWRAQTSDPAPTTTTGSTRTSGTIEVQMAPPATAPTDVELLLNATPPSNRAAAPPGYVFAATVDPSRPDRVDFVVTAPPGRYLARIRVLGADSPLTVDKDPSSPNYQRFVGPIVEIG